MIISKTPLRMSFLGGGTDLPPYYRRHGGVVVSSSIDKYIFVTVNRKFDDRIRVSYSVTEEVDSARQVSHPLVRAALIKAGIDSGIEITSIADIPASGTGLGSSSSFSVGLLHALSAFKGDYATPESLAADACNIEIDICREPIGKQDQYAAAYGGFNMIHFHPDDSVTVEPIVCRREHVAAFEAQLLCFYTDRTRSASNILRTQSERSADDPAMAASLQTLKGLADDFVKALHSGDIRAMGAILHAGWELKRVLSEGITNPEIDGYYQAARREGAIGGKLLGAGGGGFLLVQAEPERHDAIRSALAPLRCVRMPLSREGSRIIFYHPSAT